MTWMVVDVMSSPVVTVKPSASCSSCLELIRWREVSSLPVVGTDGKFMGIVTEADMERRCVDPTATAADVMNTGAATIHPSASLAAAARLMIRRGVNCVPVVDSENRVRGIVSRVDVLRVFIRSDEAIRKEIVHGLLNELPLLGRGRVKVDVTEGVVHLRGEVESTALTGLLLRLVSAVPGVAGVESHLLQAPHPLMQGAANG